MDGDDKNKPPNQMTTTFLLTVYICPSYQPVEPVPPPVRANGRTRAGSTGSLTRRKHVFAAVRCRGRPVAVVRRHQSQWMDRGSLIIFFP